MIPSTHLRQGNIVQDSFGRAGTVISFSRTAINLKMEHSRLRLTSDPGVKGLDVDGVPLTEEWLVKLGFERQSVESPFDSFSTYELRHGRTDMRITFPDDDKEVYSICFNHDFMGWNEIANCNIVESVHQLQNLYFALTGTELTLKPESI